MEKKSYLQEMNESNLINDCNQLLIKNNAIEKYDKKH